MVAMTVDEVFMVSIVDKPCSLAPMVRTSGVSRRVLALYFQDPMFLFEILSKPEQVYSGLFVRFLFSDLGPSFVSLAAKKPSRSRL